MNEEKKVELKDTVELMNSKDYKERFVAEYMQLVIRGAKLATMIEKHERGELDFEPKCPIYLLKLQVIHMNNYKEDLEKRAKIEGIELCPPRQ